MRKTFELIATTGPAQDKLTALFAALEPDPKASLDGVRNTANMPLEDEPDRVRHDLDPVLGNRLATRS